MSKKQECLESAKCTTQFNLIDDPWIPVLWNDGRYELIGIRSAFTQAGNIRQIAASNPMDRVALLRFLLAVLMWCKQDAKSSLAALDEKGAGISENWLTKLNENKSAFNLLGDGKRFYQDESLKDKEARPIGDLLVEFPGAESVNHMRHVVHDGSYGFCPACCAMGILRLSVWSPANRFYPASINPGSAAYAFVEGKNLIQTLCENLPETNLQSDQAPWLRNDQPESPDAVVKLAWRSRKLWLNVGNKNDHCANCGSFGELITSLCNEGGWSPPVTDGQQFGKNVLTEFQKISDDYKSKKTDKRKLADKVVKVAQLIRKCRMAALSQADSDAEHMTENENLEAKIARVFDHLYAAGKKEIIKNLTGKPTKDEKPLLDQQDTQVKKFWIEDPHLLKDAEALGLPDLNADASVQASRFWRDAYRLRGQRQGKVSAIGPVVNKFTFQDATSVSVPGASVVIKSQIEISDACSGKLSDLLKLVTQNAQLEHPEISAFVKLLTPNTEAQIRDRLSHINAPMGDNVTEDKAFLHEVYASVVEQVIASVTPGSPLRRRDAKNHAQALLNKKIKYLVEKPDHSSRTGTQAAVPGKSKRGLKKGGSE